MINLEDTRIIFDERKEEIEEFLRFLKILTNKKATISTGENSVEVSITFTHILKAQGYLILYNLVESTVANAISAIHKYFYENDISFNRLPDSLQKKMLKQLCKEGPSTIAPIDRMSSLSREIIKKSYNKKSLFAGNIDTKKVNELSEDYGFDIRNTDYRITGHGRFIKNVKDNRNDLAHGNKSFTDCGRDTSIDDLITAFKQIPEFLNTILNGVDFMLQSYDDAA